MMYEQGDIIFEVEDALFVLFVSGRSYDLRHFQEISKHEWVMIGYNVEVCVHIPLSEFEIYRVVGFWHEQVITVMLICLKE